MHCNIGWNSLSITVTDPLCPNCMKNIIDAGVRTVYIDSEGLNKAFYRRREADFKRMSMKLAELAGVEVFLLNRGEKQSQPLSPFLNQSELNPQKTLARTI